MAGVLEWLDTVTTKTADVAGKAIDVYGKYIEANAAEKAADIQADQRQVQNTSTLQASVSGSNNMMMWVAIGAVVVIGGVLLMRRR